MQSRDHAFMQRWFNKFTFSCVSYSLFFNFVSAVLITPSRGQDAGVYLLDLYPTLPCGVIESNAPFEAIY